MKQFESLVLESRKRPGPGSYEARLQERKNLKYSFPKVDRRLVNHDGFTRGALGPGAYEANQLDSFSRYEPKGSCYGSFGKQMRSVDTRKWGKGFVRDVGRFYA